MGLTCRWMLATAFASIASTAVACSLITSFSGFGDGVKDPSVDGGPAPDGARNPCADAGGHGPAMVAADGLCIDSTEVTIDQYTEFLEASAGNVGAQQASCVSWNTSLVPGVWPASASGNTPIVNVNWCQAFLYCQWAGKRLCGDPDGGAADPTGWNDPAKSQWYRACSANNDGLHVYPYGLTYVPTRCNGLDDDAGQPVPALASCQGGYAGIFDMSGNVWEWEDACGSGDAGDSGAQDLCNRRGGSFLFGVMDLRCDSQWTAPRNAQWSDMGIRCCSP